MSNRTKSILVAVSCLFMLVMTGLSSSGAFGGRTIEDVSYNANEILVPAPFTFAIWGLIYIGMIAFTIYQLRKDTLHDSTIQKIRPRIALNFIANGLWLPAATLLNRSWTTIVLILFMWFTLGYINKELKGYAHAKATKRYIVMPMSIYFGWITIATPLNMASLVNQRGFTPAVQSVPRVLFWIGLAFVTSIIVFTRLRYISYIAVTLWALIGVIAVRHYDAPFVSRIAIFLFMATILYIFVRGSQKKLLWQ